MRSISFKALLALGVVAVTPIAAHAGPSGHYSVELNKTEVVYLPANAGAVVVGRGYGETNLVILDAEGHKIMDADIQVVNNLPAHGVRIYNGKERETYSCAPYCQPAPVLGDSRAFVANNQGGGAAINNNIASGVPTQSAVSRPASTTSRTQAGLTGAPSGPPAGFSPPGM